MDVLSLVLQGTEVRGQQATIPEPALLAQRLTTVYRRWDRRQRIDLVALAEGFLHRLGSPDDPLGAACLAAAEAVERWGGHEYHSAHHHAEVATNVMLIAELGRWLRSGLDPHAALLLLASSLAHDLDYEPTPAPAARFDAEVRSARALLRIADDCGVASADQRMMSCLILATEPGFRGALRQLGGGVRLHESLPALLEPITVEPILVALASILSDGDLLSSAGLTQQWHQVQVSRLERETGRPIGAGDDMAFLERIVGPGFLSPGGRYFDPNLARLRAALGRRSRVQSARIALGTVSA